MIELARTCAQTRLKDIDNVTSIDLNSMLRTRRVGDDSNDLYTTFNRDQESIIRGYAKYTTLEDNKLKTRSVSKLRSVSKRIELNQELWQNMETIAA